MCKREKKQIKKKNEQSHCVSEYFHRDTQPNLNGLQIYYLFAILFIHSTLYGRYPYLCFSLASGSNTTTT